MAVESEFVWHSNRGSALAYADPPDRGRTVNVDKEGDAGPELLGRESMLARLLLLPLLLAGPTASRLSRGDGRGVGVVDDAALEISRRPLGGVALGDTGA